MAVLRIVPNIAAGQLDEVAAFYRDLLGLGLVMDRGSIAIYTANSLTSPQITFTVEDGSGTPVPDVSMEVDDVDDVYDRATRADFEILYGIVTESWGVRRFFVRDSFGKIVNVFSYTTAQEIGAVAV